MEIFFDSMITDEEETASEPLITSTLESNSADNFRTKLVDRSMAGDEALEDAEVIEVVSLSG